MEVQKQDLITEIERFKTESLKTHVVKVWAESYTNSDPFGYVILERENNKIFWMKTQAHQLWSMWQAAKASAVPEANKREGGYYIRDLRSPIGNCMKFWYQAGYGTKHKNFFWCETLEEAKKYRGGCTRFEIWHAPYIDSLVEYTVDFQLADRSVGLVDLNAQAVV